MEASDITWIDPNIVPNAAHLIHHWNVWCIVNNQNKIAVYGMGTSHLDANSLQGNQHRRIAEKFLEMYKPYGAVGLALIPHVFLPDSLGRY